MEITLILCVPLTIGGMWGFLPARSLRFSIAVLLTSPLVSAALVGVGFGMMNMLTPPDPVAARPLIERITIYLATGCLYGEGFGLFGAIPAIIGSAGTQLFMLWVGARLASHRRRESGDIH